MIEIEQQYVFQECKEIIGRIILSNIFKTSQQHCCTTAAGMLQVFKVVIPTSQKALIPHCVSLNLKYKQTVLRRRRFACVLSIKQCTLYLKIFLSTFSKESSTLPQNVFKNVRNKSGSCTVSALRRCTGMKQYSNNFYIRITQTIQLESNQHQVRKDI